VGETVEANLMFYVLSGAFYMGLHALTSGEICRYAVLVFADMQCIFREETPWHVPWMGKVIPNILNLCVMHSKDTIFIGLSLQPMQSAALKTSA
jgi:hypothetical protein